MYIPHTVMASYQPDQQLPHLRVLLPSQVPTAEDLATLKKASTEGISLGGDSGRQVLPQLIIDEAVIVSNLFNLNQLAALHLLQTGACHKSLTRVSVTPFWLTYLYVAKKEPLQ